MGQYDFEFNDRRRITEEGVQADKFKSAQDMEEEAAEKRLVTEFISGAEKRWRSVAEREAPVRKDMLDDVQFSVGKQWPDDMQAQRDQDGRPCLTMNRSKQFLKVITGEQRQQRSSVVVNPVGNGADKDTAEALEGIIRHIDNISDAEVIYDTAFDSMARCGRGYWRVITEYESDRSFRKIIKLQWIRNQFSVYLDQDAKQPDKSDARFGFITQIMSLDEYKERHKGSAAASMHNFSGIGDSDLQMGLDQDHIRIAEYFYAEDTDVELVLLDDQTVMESHEFERLMEEHVEKQEDFDDGALGAQEPGPVPMVVDRRTAVKRQIKWAKINAVEILAQRDWEGKYIPIVELVGDDLEVDGEKYIAGVLRDYKDPQRMYNYWISAATETIALAPKAPYIYAEGQLEGHEEMWRQANVRNYAALPYKPKSVDNSLVPPPQRQQYEPPIQGMSMMVRQADNDMKATTGIYDASLGQRGPDESGKAILERKKQGDLSTLGYMDNLARSLRHSGRILLDLIPKILTAPQIQRIIKPDGGVDHVGVFNSQMGHEADTVSDMKLMQGIKRIFDIGVGDYDVTMQAGPSYPTKRAEAVSSIMALVQSYPQLMQAAGDILVRNMDWPGADEIADRLKKMLPPNLIEDDDPDPQAKMLKLQSQLQAMMQQHQVVVQELQKASELIRTKRLDLESKERIAQLQARVDILTVQAKIEGEGALAHLQEQLTVISDRLIKLHENMGIDEEDGEAGAAPVSGS